MDVPAAAEVAPWFELCHRAGVGLADATAMAEHLASAYSEPERAYHTLRHIESCLGWMREAPLDGEDRIVAEFAIWFHDVVYDTRTSDNEARSAEVARRWMTDVGREGGDRVADIVNMTAAHVVPSNADLATMVVHDVDLSILGSARDVYDQYVADVRSEYSWINDADFHLGRIAVVHSLLEMEVIYALPSYRSAFESQARSNLERELVNAS